MLLATEAKRIVFLREPVEGSASEKRLADAEALVFGPAGSAVMEVLAEVGFPGYAPEGASVVRPHKKPRGGALTVEQQEGNRQKARARVVVEHAIGGVEVWRMVKEQVRSWLHQVRDQVMDLACGLHNVRLTCRAGPIQP